VCDTDRRTHLPHRSDNISPLNSIRIFPWIKALSFSRDSPNLLYHGFPRRAVRVTRDRPALEKERKKAYFPFLVVAFLLWLCIHSANNPHDRLSHLLSYPFLAMFFWAGNGRPPPQIFCLTSFVHRFSVQASRQSSAFYFHHLLGAGALQNPTLFLFCQEASACIFLDTFA